MSNGKFLLALIGLVMLFQASLNAQHMPKRSPEERAQNQVRWMDKNLNLSEEQHRKMYDIVLKYTRENEQVAGEPKGRGKKMDKMAVMQDRDKEIRSVLTVDQYDKYMAHMEQQKEKRMARKRF